MQLSDMKMVVSSNISAVGYDEKELKLHIVFKDKAHYAYKDVPKSLWDEFQKAPSKGHFLGKRVKHIYKFDQVE